MTDQAAAPAGQAPAASSAAPAASTDTGSMPQNWMDSLSPEARYYAEAKGWKDTGALVESYRNLEKLQGVPKEQLLKLPGENAAPEEWNGVWDRLGRPSDPNGYNLAVPETADPAFAEWAKGTFHELGMPANMGKALVDKWNGYMEEQFQAAETERTAALEKEDSDLRVRWGQAYDTNVRQGQIAAQKLGIDPQTIDALEAGMGFAKVMELFHNIGSKIGEGAYVDGDGGQTGFGVMSPEAAQQEIAALKQDKEFITKYSNGDRDARTKMDRLMKFAFPS